jgi:hypothetical protein
MTLVGKILNYVIDVLNSGGFAAIIAAGAAYVGKIKYDSKKEAKQLKKEIKDLSSGVVIDLSTFNDILHKVNNIFTQTCIDRFLILSAMNGKEDLRICTANYEQVNVNGNVSSKLSLGATGRYFNFAFDKAYRDMLKRIERNQVPEECKVSQMQDCDLKRIYLNEKVTEAHVFFLKRVKIDNYNDRVFYCSYATHRSEGISDNDALTIRLYHQNILETFKALTNDKSN